MIQQKIKDFLNSLKQKEQKILDVVNENVGLSCFSRDWRRRVCIRKHR
jgi:hypothetical protein